MEDLRQPVNTTYEDKVYRGTIDNRYPCEREFRSLRAVVHWRPLAAVDWKARWPPPVSTRMRATVLRTSNSPLPLTTFLLRYFVENFPLIKLQLTSSFKYFLSNHAYIYKESVHWFNRYFFSFRDRVTVWCARRVSLRQSTCRRAQSPGNTAPVASAPNRSNGWSTTIPALFRFFCFSFVVRGISHLFYAPMIIPVPT